MARKLQEELQIKAFVSRLNEANMYLITDTKTRHAVLIDPSEERSVCEWIVARNLRLDYIILTHEHYDHIAALNEIRECFPMAKAVASKACSKGIQSPQKNMSKFFNCLLAFKQEKDPDSAVMDIEIEPYQALAADMVFERELQMKWKGHEIHLREAPGHSEGGILIVIDKNYLFSGDTLSYDFDLITRFPGGSGRKYQQVTRPLLRNFDREMKVYPGHGRSFQLYEKEEF